MTVNFLDRRHRPEAVKRDILLYIYDPAGNAPACTSNVEIIGARWAARVDNAQGLPLQFVPVDNNIPILRPDGSTCSRCDGMLLYTDDGTDTRLDRPQGIAFVELKDEGEGWISHAVDQLRTTVTCFNACHPDVTFRWRYAYAANCRHPKFQVSNKDRMQQFRQLTGFRLLIQDVVRIRRQ